MRATEEEGERFTDIKFLAIGMCTKKNTPSQAPKLTPKVYNTGGR